MKNRLFILLFIVSFICCRAENTSVSMYWTVDTTPDSLGYFDNSLKIINEGNTSLDKDWTIYFTQFPMAFLFQETSPVNIEQISGSFYKMYPTSYYKSLEKSDTLSVNWKTKRDYKGISFLPESAYIVSRKNGVEQTPQNIKITIIRNDSEANPAKGGQPQYPTSSMLYDENAKFSDNVALSETDIIPSIKSVKNKADAAKFVFSKEVNIIYDPLYSNEAKLLEESLKKLFGCNVSKQGATTIRLSRADAGAKLLNKEHYLLNIGEKEINIAGNNPHAIFNGTQTLLSLLMNKALPADLSQCEISDYPDFTYRGIMIDVARNFTKKENLMRLMDVLSMYKTDVLHIHIADDEGWRIQIPGLDELTEVASRRGQTTDESDRLYPVYGSGWNPDDTTSLGNGYYTRQDFIDILNYAKQRHIIVVTEVDMPGHARAAITAMKARYNKYVNTDPAKAGEYLLTSVADTSRYISVQAYKNNVVNVALPSTYRFIDKVIKELSSMYKDAGLEMGTINIGGDEVPKGAWTGSPECMAVMKKEGMTDVGELADYFVKRVLEIARREGITVSGWQEIALKSHENVIDPQVSNKEIISYCWEDVLEPNGGEIVYKLANAGFPVILSNVSNLYLDMAYSPNFHEPGLNWGGYVDEFCPFNMQPFDIYKSVRRDISGKQIDVDMMSGNGKVALQPDARKQILGMQGQLFSETIRSFDMVLYYLFPKMLGLAERAWNAEPEWMQTGVEKDYEESVNLFNTKIGKEELPKLKRLDVDFRVAEPGLKMIDGYLYANSRIPGSVIRFTTDGSEPRADSEEWQKPVACTAPIIKAKVFYLGKESVTVIMINNNGSGAN